MYDILIVWDITISHTIKISYRFGTFSNCRDAFKKKSCIWSNKHLTAMQDSSDSTKISWFIFCNVSIWLNYFQNSFHHKIYFQTPVTDLTVTQEAKGEYLQRNIKENRQRKTADTDPAKDGVEEASPRPFPQGPEAEEIAAGNCGVHTNLPVPV